MIANLLYGARIDGTVDNSRGVSEDDNANAWETWKASIDGPRDESIKKRNNVYANYTNRIVLTGCHQMVMNG